MYKYILYFIAGSVLYCNSLYADPITIQSSGDSRLSNFGGTITGNLNVTGKLTKSGYRTPVILDSRYIGASMTGTTSTQLATFTIPGGLMGINGSVDVYTEFEFADTTGQKAINCTNAANDLFSIFNLGTTTVGYSATALLFNKGSTTSNLNKKIWRSYTNTTVTGSLVNMSVDTGTDTTWTIKTNNVAPATGTITLHTLRVMLYPGD